MNSIKRGLTNFALFIILLVGACRGAPANQDASRDEPGPFWLSGDSVSEQMRSNNVELYELLERVGPNMRSSSDYHDFKDINLNHSVAGWQVLHHQARLFAKTQVHFFEPKLEQLLKEANVSLDCARSLNETMRSLEELDSWAVQSKYS